MGGGERPGGFKAAAKAEARYQPKHPLDSCPKCGLFNYACKCPSSVANETTPKEKT